MEIAGRKFLVTGAASGLGEATSRHLAGLGAFVVMADISPRGEQVAQELGSSAVFQVTDVSDSASVERLVEVLISRPGKIGGAVNCAGILQGTRVVGRNGPHDPALFERVIRVNLIGTFHVMRLAATAMSKQEPNQDGERGVIINTASIAAWEGQIGQAAYSASKAGVVGMTLPAARDLAKLGIRVMAIAPGAFETSMIGGLTDELQRSLEEQVPFPSRLGRPGEFAALVEHILRNPMLNGSVIRLDGAMRMGPK